MRCPADNELLVMAERHGVEIDYCPKCRGVWLDRGELDKILEKAVPAAPAASAPPRDEARGHSDRDYDRDRGYDRDRDYDRDRGGKPYRKRESFLSELFDF